MIGEEIRPVKYWKQEQKIVRKEQESTEVHETLLGKSLLVYKNGGLSKYTKEMTANFHKAKEPKKLPMLNPMESLLNENSDDEKFQVKKEKVRMPVLERNSKMNEIKFKEDISKINDSFLESDIQY